MRPYELLCMYIMLTFRANDGQVFKKKYENVNPLNIKTYVSLFFECVFNVIPNRQYHFVVETQHLRMNIFLLSESILFDFHVFLPNIYTFVHHIG